MKVNLSCRFGSRCLPRCCVKFMANCLHAVHMAKYFVPRRSCGLLLAMMIICTCMYTIVMVNGTFRGRRKCRDRLAVIPARSSKDGRHRFIDGHEFHDIGCWQVIPLTWRRRFILRERAVAKNMSADRCVSYCIKKKAMFAMYGKLLKPNTQHLCVCEHNLTEYQPTLACSKVCPGESREHACRPSYSFVTFFIARRPTEEKITKVHILTYHKTRSAFTGGIFKTSPHSFYISEPFWPSEIENEFRSTSSNKQAALIVSAMLKCEFHKLSEPFLFRLRRMNDESSAQLTTFSQCVQDTPTPQDVCVNLLRTLCEQTTLRVIKTVRLQIDVTSMLSVIGSDIRTIHQVRDPRPMLSSRRLTGNSLAKLTCSDVYRNAVTSRFLSNVYFLRYEDLVFNPQLVVESMFAFLHLEVSNVVKTWLNNETKDYYVKTGQGGVGALVNSKQNAFYWKVHYRRKFSTLLKIQNECSYAMKLCGYVKVDKVTQLSERDFWTVVKPVLKYKHGSPKITLKWRGHSEM